MITLNSIYSETNLFDKVTFHLGINIILGKYSTITEKSSINGIGKSTLVRLINFAFLSNLQGSLDIKHASFLKEHTVSVEFTVGNEAYKITRGFAHKDIVYFGIKNRALLEYDIKELKTILSDILFVNAITHGQVYQNNWFRDLLRFFISDDIHRHKQDNPIKFVGYEATKAVLIAYNFFLLNLPNNEFVEFDTVQKTIKSKKNSLDEIEKSIKSDTGKDISALRTELALLNERLKQLEDALQEFEFIESYKNIEDALKQINNQISEKLKIYHSYNKTLAHYQNSYDLNLEIDIERVKAIYSSLNEELGKFVQATLAEVLEFRRQISENRKKFLADREKKLEQAINLTLKEIIELEERRKKLYLFLNEVGALDSIKNAYEQLMMEKVDAERSKTKLIHWQEINEAIAQETTRLTELIGEISRIIQANQKNIDGLRLLFKEILENVIFMDENENLEKGYLDIKSNLNQQNPLDIIINIHKEASLGKYRFKLLAYSLTVFFNIITQGRLLPHFLIHDGVFHGMDKRTMLNALNYIYEKSRIHPTFQYIVTGNEEEFDLNSGGDVLGNYAFDFPEHIIAIYESSPEKMIFKREY